MTQSGIDLTPVAYNVFFGINGQHVVSPEAYKPPVEIKPEIRANAIDLESAENLWLNEIVADIKQSIRKKYEWAGIDINTDTMPELLLVPKKFCPEQIVGGELYANGQQRIIYLSRDTYDIGSNTAIVYLDEENLSLSNISSIYHEMEHGSSAKLLVQKTRLSQTDVSPFISLGHGIATLVGFRTDHKPFQGEQVHRGRVLEEGYVEYMSINYLLESNNPTITKLKNDYLDRLVISRGLGDWRTWPEIRQKRELWKSLNNNRNLGDIALPEYEEAAQLVEYILLDAQIIYGIDEKDDLLKQMIRTRIIPIEKRKLIDQMDKVYGRAFSRAFFLCPFDAESIKNLYLLMTKARDETRNMLVAEQDKLQ